MNKYKLYDYCKLLRTAEVGQEPMTWYDVHKNAIKHNVITSYVSLQELKSTYREVAGELALGNKIQEDVAKYDQDAEKFFNWIGKSKDFVNSHPPVEKTEEEISIIITDVHVPYHHKENLKRVIDEWSGKAHRLIVGGDFLNGTQLSAHPKMIVEDFQKELSEGRQIAELLDSAFPEVIYTDDNHVHGRMQRLLAKVMTPDLHFLVQHPYDLLLKNLPNSKRAKAYHTSEYGEDIGWFHVQGDSVIAHAESSSGIDLKATRQLESWLNKWSPILGLPKIRFIAQGHVHRLSITYDADSAVCQTGCMTSMEALRYSLTPELKGHPPSHGYVVLVQKNGVTDLNKTHVVKLPL